MAGGWSPPDAVPSCRDRGRRSTGRTRSGPPSRPRSSADALAATAPESSSSRGPEIDINALKTNGSIPGGYTVNHFLTDTNAWFLKTDVPNGLKHFTRAGMSTSMDGDFDTGNARYKARERYSFGVSDPLGMYGSPGA